MCHLRSIYLVSLEGIDGNVSCFRLCDWAQDLVPTCNNGRYGLWILIWSGVVLDFLVARSGADVCWQATAGSPVE